MQECKVSNYRLISLLSFKESESMVWGQVEERKTIYKSKAE